MCYVSYMKKSETKNTLTAVFLSIYGLVCEKFILKMKKEAVNASISSFMVICSCDISKTSVMQKCQLCHKASSFLLFVSKEWTNMAVPWRAQTLYVKQCFCGVNIDKNNNHNKPADGSTCTFSRFSGQLVFSLVSPLIYGAMTKRL